MASRNKKSRGKKAAKPAARTKAAGTRAKAPKATKPRATAARRDGNIAAKPKTAGKAPAAKKTASLPAPSGERVIAETSRRMVAAAAAACDEKKAEDVRILEL